jgi:hypothetical protein
MYVFPRTWQVGRILRVGGWGTPHKPARLDRDYLRYPNKKKRSGAEICSPARYPEQKSALLGAKRSAGSYYLFVNAFLAVTSHFSTYRHFFVAFDRLIPRNPQHPLPSTKQRR